MTYTVVAAGEDGAVGLATCSHSMFVATKTVHLDAGGDRPLVVVSQAFSSRALGAAALAELRGGATAGDALDAALCSEPQPQLRQLLVANRNGTATKTGNACVRFADDVASDDGRVAVAGNMLDTADVVPALLDAFERATGDLADRLVAALQAGHAAGGDFRGDRSAAVVVLDASGHGAQLTVDEHSQPIGELARLLELHRADVAVRRSMAWWLGPAGPPPTDLRSDLQRALPHLGETGDVWLDLIDRESGAATTTSPGRSSRFERSVQGLLDARAASRQHAGDDHV